MKGYVDQSDQLILALLRNMSFPAPVSSAPSLAAVNLGNHRILTKHPAAPFMLVDGDDIIDTPRILFQQYEQGISCAIETLAHPGGTFVDLGAGQGFHTLTMSVAAGRTGNVFAVEPNPSAAKFLTDNLIATGLSQNTTVFPPDRDIAGVMKWLKEQFVARQLRPDLFRIGASIKDVPVREGLREWIAAKSDTSPNFLLTLPLGNALASELAEAGYSFWIVQSDGAFFRSSRQELDERGKSEELHVLASRRLGS